MEEHADYEGPSLTWGLTYKLASAAQCCQACKEVRCRRRQHTWDLVVPLKTWEAIASCLLLAGLLPKCGVSVQRHARMRAPRLRRARLLCLQKQEPDGEGRRCNVWVSGGRLARGSWQRAAFPRNCVVNTRCSTLLPGATHMLHP